MSGNLRVSPASAPSGGRCYTRSTGELHYRSMKVTAERIPEARVVLEVEVDDERLQRSLDQAYRRLAPRARIPGFRPGKAPRALVERALGRTTLLQEAMDRLLPEAYDDAVREQGLSPLAPPELEILNLEPVRFKATVPLQPEVQLGDYRSLALLPEPVVVSNAMIDAALLDVRRKHALLEPVDRPVQYNDRLRLDLRATVDGQTLLDQKNIDFILREGMEVAVPGLAPQLLGLTQGPEHALTVAVPPDSPESDIAGKTLTFAVTIHELKQEILPEPNDDLATEAGDFPSFAALRERVAADLRVRETMRVKEAYHRALLEAVVGQSSAEFPPVMVDYEVEQLAEDLARVRGQKLEAYLESLGEKRAETLAQLRPVATHRVLERLVLSDIADAEQIQVSETDIDAEIARLAGDGPSAERIRALFDTENGRIILLRNLMAARTLERLTQIATANAAPTIATAPAPAEPPPSNPENPPPTAETGPSNDEESDA